jgi:prophage regulatory protein
VSQPKSTTALATVSASGLALPILLKRKQVVALTGYSGEHLRRLEAAGKFPQHLKLGSGRSAHVSWLATEIQAWIDARIAARDSGAEHIRTSTSDRGE